MSAASLKVNGHVHSVDADPACPLLYVLRDNLDEHTAFRLRPRSMRRVHGAGGQ